jgi:Nif-specific regulatory protein
MQWPVVVSPSQSPLVTPPSERQVQEILTLFANLAQCPHSPAQLLLLASQQAASVLRAETAAVLLFDQERQELHGAKVSAHSFTAAPPTEIRFPASHGLAGWVLREGIPAYASAPWRETRVALATELAWAQRPRSYLCVPLKTRQHNLGVLTIVNKHVGLFAQEDVYLAEMVASQLAAVMTNARLSTELATVRDRLGDASVDQTDAIQLKQRFDTVIGVSPAMQAVYRLLEPILSTTTTVLLTGESGTGKEIIARVIHTHGVRAKRPFIAVNCAAIPETLLEAELFGYERGAFTGAVQRKLGRFELASGGTLLLDEIGELNLTLQAKLLRVLQEKSFERVGGTQPIKLYARIVAATNRQLETLVAEGAFREDLLYRINVYPITLPPLRERQEDLLPLAAHFLKKYSEKLGKHGMQLSLEARALLLKHQWPGNIRELEHVIERAVLLSHGQLITEQDLPLNLQDIVPEPVVKQEALAMPMSGMTWSEVEKQYIQQVLEQAGYNHSRASRRLGVSRSQLRTRLKRYSLEGKIKKD